MFHRQNNTKPVEKISNASESKYRKKNDEIDRILFLITIRIRQGTRGAPREARCECNDQIELCG